MAIDDKRSVSAAAVELQRSQPSVSSALGKLRTFFADPLFIRSGNTMQPTPRAVGIMGPVRDVLSRIGMDIVASSTFEPARSHRPIVLALSDVGEVVFLPAILQQLRNGAGTSLHSVSLPAEEIASGLEGGTIDLALGYFPNLKRHNFFQQTLFSDTFTCLIRTDHPVKSPRLSPRQFLQLDHAVVRAESRTEEVIERFLTRRRIHRRVTLTTPHFKRAAHRRTIRSGGHGTGAAGSLFCDRFRRNPDRTATLRSAPDRSEADLAPQFHHDERNRWLRNLMCGLFQKQSAETEREDCHRGDRRDGHHVLHDAGGAGAAAINRPASNGPVIDPTRPTACAPNQCREWPLIEGRRDTVQRIVGAEQTEAHCAAQLSASLAIRCAQQYERCDQQQIREGQRPPKAKPVHQRAKHQRARNAAEIESDRGLGRHGAFEPLAMTSVGSQFRIR